MSALAISGWLIPAIRPTLVGGLLVAVVALALLLDYVKIWIFRRIGVG